ncbi:MAG: D-glycerate dehydrogenase [Ignavibacteria bacterium]|nr:D-glycerate dehydrogenase [Ignavibacteria bacterium]
MRPNIVITHMIPEKGVNMLRKKFDVEYHTNTDILSKKQIISLVKDKDVFLSLLTDKIDKEVIDSCPNLKMISNYAVGYNNIDVKYATKKNIIVTNTPRTLDETTSDFVFALILAVSRRIVESDKFMRSGKFKGWNAMDFIGFDVFNSTLGIIGMGSIGKEVALRGYHGFNMKILYSDRSVKPDMISVKARHVNLHTLLKESDFVTLNIPLSQETYHLIGEEELRIMKKTAYLINTARGEVVDEKALYKALKEKWIAGAAIDVYEEEPKFTHGLEKLNNIIMTPHIASASLQTRELMSAKAAKNIIDVFDGRIPEGLVNKEILSDFNVKSKLLLL